MSDRASSWSLTAGPGIPELISHHCVCICRLCGVSDTAGCGVQGIPKEINPGYSLEELMLELQYFVHLMQRADLLEKTLMLGRIEGKRKREQQMMRWLDSTIDSTDMNLSKL